MRLARARSQLRLAPSSNKRARSGASDFDSGSRASASVRYDAFLQGMRHLGHIEGKSFTVEARYADGKADILPGLTAELIRQKVEVFVATGGPVSQVLQKATRTIPSWALC